MKLATTLFLALLAASPVARGQTDAAQWRGVWQAEGTLFRIAVDVEESTLKVSEVESLGFLWSATEGEIKGDQVTLQVRTQGVTAEVVAELIGEGRAVVRPLSCMPDYMVACALSRGRQATFVRLDEAEQSSSSPAGGPAVRPR